jgi:uncharacterized protein (UPF0335 family)
MVMVREPDSPLDVDVFHRRSLPTVTERRLRDVIDRLRTLESDRETVADGVERLEADTEFANGATLVEA